MTGGADQPIRSPPLRSPRLSLALLSQLVLVDPLADWVVAVASDAIQAEKPVSAKPFEAVEVISRAFNFSTRAMTDMFDAAVCEGFGEPSAFVRG